MLLFSWHSSQYKFKNHNIQQRRLCDIRSPRALGILQKRLYIWQTDFLNDFIPTW